ncbi:MAG: S-layer homology domain-containing protein, partial [Clostridia bacterium]|nr:S-layer homology domain-containing protein [Clostridia bacterium]
MKKTLIIGGALALLLSLNAFASGFEKTLYYAEGQFSDVNENAWYAETVKNTFELGLMNGTGNGLFEPEGNVTVAEAITMASRACAINAGEDISEKDG